MHFVVFFEVKQQDFLKILPHNGQYFTQNV